MSYSFTGPTLAGLFPGIAGAVCVGTVYHSLVKTKSSPVYILVMREIAAFALYHFASLMMEAPRRRAEAYASISLAVNSLTLGVLIHKGMVGIFGTALYISIMAIDLMCKIADFPKFRS